MTRFATAFFVLIGLLFSVPAGAQSFDDLVNALPEGNFAERGAVVDALAATGDDRALAILEALSEGDLHTLDEDGSIVILREVGRTDMATDALTGADRGEVASRASDRIRVNNSLRRVIRAAIGTITLRHPNPDRRMAAAEAAFRAADPEMVEALVEVRGDEADPAIVVVLDQAIAASTLAGDAASEDRVAARAGRGSG